MDIHYIDRQLRRTALTRLRWHAPLLGVGLGLLPWIPLAAAVPLALALAPLVWSCTRAVRRLRGRGPRALASEAEELDAQLASPRCRRFGRLMLTPDWLIDEGRFEFQAVPLDEIRSLRVRGWRRRLELELRAGETLRLSPLDASRRRPFLRELGQRAPQARAGGPRLEPQPS